jgi:hypothetical protein
MNEYSITKTTHYNTSVRKTETPDTAIRYQKQQRKKKKKTAGSAEPSNIKDTTNNRPYNNSSSLMLHSINILRAPFKSPLPQNSSSDFPNMLSRHHFTPTKQTHNSPFIVPLD